MKKSFYKQKQPQQTWWGHKLETMGWYSNYLPRTIRGKLIAPDVKEQKRRALHKRKKAQEKWYREAINDC